jgi:putative salt-induced outer membrane protein YdiY
LTAGLNGSYGEVEGVKNNEVARGTFQYNRLLGDTDSYFFGKADLLHDSVADVEYRLSLSPGYYFTKNEKTKLSAEIGPGYIFEKVGSLEDDYLTLRVGERFEYKINDRARLWQSVEFMPQVDEFSNYLLVAEIGVESDLTEKMSLRVSLQDNYDNQPAAGRKSNDLRLVTGIGYKF